MPKNPRVNKVPTDLDWIQAALELLGRLVFHALACGCRLIAAALRSL